MAKYYYQEVAETGSFAAPYPDDYATASSLRELRNALGRWDDTVQQYSEARGELLVWRGEPEGALPCDCPPDFQMTLGPRGGVVVLR